MIVTLPQRIQQLIERHGSLRATGRALRIDPGYLLRLKTCEKYHPSMKTLRKLHLAKAITTRYVLREKEPHP